MIRHYKGKLGTFDYDDTQFCICKRPYYKEGDNTDRNYLSYIGKEQANKIKIPLGINDCYSMFASNPTITETPYIPEGVKFCDDMFYNCRHLNKITNFPSTLIQANFMFEHCAITKIEILPENLEYAYSMFSVCYRLEECSAPLPKSLRMANYMFSGCTKLQTTPFMEDGIKYATSMFEGCESLTTVTNFPNSIVEANSMFLNCKKLKNLPKRFPENLQDASQMFSSCRTLDVTPQYLPDKLVKAESMFLSCDIKETVRNIPKSLKDCDSMYAFNSNLSKNYLSIEYLINKVNSSCMFRECMSLDSPTHYKNYKKTNKLSEDIKSLGISVDTALPALVQVSKKPKDKPIEQYFTLLMTLTRSMNVKEPF